MSTCIIYYSYSGITQGVAGRIRDACGCEILEVRPTEEYSDLTVVLKGCIRSNMGARDRIGQDEIDVSGYDLIVIGTPVWALKPTPVINGAIAALRGCEGKKGMVFATCDGSPGPGSTIEELRHALAEKGIDIVDSFVLTGKEIEDDLKIQDIISSVKLYGVAS